MLLKHLVMTLLPHPGGLVQVFPLGVEPLVLSLVALTGRDQSLQRCDGGLAVLQVLQDHLNSWKYFYNQHIYNDIAPQSLMMNECSTFTLKAAINSSEANKCLSSTAAGVGYM